MSSLLPGLREVRTPLTCGYVWLVVTWLLVGAEIPTERPSTQAFALLWDLGTYVGKSGLFAAVSFAAYLVGAFLEIDPLRMWHRGGRPEWLNKIRELSKWGPLRRVSFYPVSIQAQRDLEEFSREVFLLDGKNGDIDVPWRIMREERQLATRLQATNSELFNRYDRLLAESSFRVNVTPPLVVLFLVLIYESVFPPVVRTGLVVLVLVMGVLLFRQGVHRAIQSRDVIVQAVVTELVTPRTVKNLLSRDGSVVNRDDAGVA
jgi:hypothetical protein